jgi:hypothetical protein
MKLIIINPKILAKVDLIKIQKRYMHRSGPIIRVGCQSSYPRMTRMYATKTAVNFKNQAAQDLANDGTGKHPHVMQNYCVLKGCENKKCMTLCDNGVKSRITGHNTHVPPGGRFARFIAEHDANGDPKKQYFVPTNKKTEISEQEKQSYGKDIKDNKKQTSYVQNHDDKYDEGNK